MVGGEPWLRGILIEPIPEVYEQCARNRPLATVVNCACVSDDYSEPTVEMLYARSLEVLAFQRDSSGRRSRLSRRCDDAWMDRKT